MITKEFVRYFFAGGSAFLVDSTILYLLTQFGGFHYLTAASMGFMAGIIYTYALSVSWVFDHRVCSNRWQEFSVFAVIGLTGLAMNAGIMWLLTDAIGFHYLLSKVGAAAMIFLFNFYARKALLFHVTVDNYS